MSKIVGIDLGTSNSVIAVMESGEPVIIPNAAGASITPSVVACMPDGRRLVGEHARAVAAQYPENTIFSIKRLMGRKYRDAVVQQDIPLLPYKVVEHANGDSWVEVAGQRYAPPEISAMILAQLKRDAEVYLGEKVSQAIITVPAYFNDVQRQATKDAGRIAGLEVLRIINEPTAAALAYGLDRRPDERVLVFSFGGGSMDISVLELGEGVFEVKATTGDTHLGGNDLDRCIVNWLMATFQADQDIDLPRNLAALQRLRDAAERAKIDLSSTLSTEIHLPFLAYDATRPRHLHVTLTREKLEVLTQGELAKFREPITRVLRAGIWSQSGDISQLMSHINAIVLVGAQTRMPAVQRYLHELLGKEPLRHIDPETVVAVGAAIQGGVLTGDVRDVLLMDVTPFSLGIETQHKDNKKGGDEAQCSLGETVGNGSYTKLIDSNTTIPTQKSQVFSTEKNNQNRVLINVLQGERELARDNLSLGMLVLDGIPSAPHGVPQIEVTFDLDANNILSVRARDKGTGREQRLTIQALSGLTRDEIARMVAESANYTEQERAREREQEQRDAAQRNADQAQQTLAQIASLVANEQRVAIERLLAALQEALAGNDMPLIQRAQEALQQEFFQHAEQIYAAMTLLDICQQEADDAQRLLETLSSRTTAEQRSFVQQRVTGLRSALKDADRAKILAARQELQEAFYTLADQIYRTLYGERPPVPVEEKQRIDLSGLPIFVSHSHLDNVYSRQFVRALRAVGIDVWYDEDQLQYGELTSTIEQQLIQRRIFIPLLTPASLRSQWVEREAHRCQGLYRSDSTQSRILLPVVAKAIAGEGAIWPWLRDFKRVEEGLCQPVAPEDAARHVIAILHIATAHG